MNAQAQVKKSLFAKLSELVWCIGMNFSRQAVVYDDVYVDSADKAAVASMLGLGYDTNCPIAVVEVKTEEQRARIAVQLEDTWKRLKESVLETPVLRTIQGDDGLKNVELKVAPAEILRQFEERFVKNGKLNLAAVKYDPVFGFRRGGALDLANAIRFRDQLPTITEIPVNVVEFSNEHERVKMCIEENTHSLKNTRLIDKDWKSLSKAAKAFLESGIKTGRPVREIDMKNTFDLPHGSGQKLFAIIMLDAKFPELKLVDAIVNGRTPAESLQYVKLNELRRDSADAVVVQAYFANPKDETQRKKQRAKESDMVAYRDTHPIMLVRAIVKADLEDDMASLSKFIPLAAEINRLTSAFFPTTVPTPIPAMTETPLPAITK